MPMTVMMMKSIGINTSRGLSFHLHQRLFEAAAAAAATATSSIVAPIAGVKTVVLTGGVVSVIGIKVNTHRYRRSRAILAEQSRIVNVHCWTGRVTEDQLCGILTQHQHKPISTEAS